MTKMFVRNATCQDKAAIHDLYVSAFAEDERALVSELALALLMEESMPATISLIAEVDGMLAGHVAFSPVHTEVDERFLGYIVAPLAVMPEHQKHGIGTALIEHGKRAVLEAGAGVLFVYGDPAYYGRFGFDARIAERFVPPYTLQYPFGWQAIALSELAAGVSPVRVICVNALSDPALW